MEYISVHHPMRVILGHKTTKSYSNFVKVFGCKICDGQDVKSFEFIKDYFLKKNWTLLSTHYKNSQQLLELICPEGHRQKKTYSSFVQGKGCQPCYYKNNTGENHSNFKFELTEEDRVYSRTIIGYDEWIKSVFKKDDYTCQKCFERGGKLEAHHIYNYSKYKNLRVEIKNGITLCNECHRLNENSFHRTFGINDNTKEQLEIFLNRKLILDISL
jgi:hypothetical protein